MTALSQNDLDWLAARLSIAVYDTNAEVCMGRTADLKAILGPIQGIDSLKTRYTLGGLYVELNGKGFEVNSMASNDDIARNIRKINGITDPMSITGLQAGAVKDALQKIKDRQAQSLAKLSGAATKAGTVADAMDLVSAKIEKETDDALAEIGQFDNGSPA